MRRSSRHVRSSLAGLVWGALRCGATAIFLTGWLIGTGSRAQAQEQAAATTARPFARDRVDDAVDRATRYLVDSQQADGSIGTDRNRTTMTSLAIMAMAAVGHQPQDPNPTGRAMYRALDYVLQEDRQDGEGYFGRADHSRMYGHGITTLMLTEMLGMAGDARQDKEIHHRLQRAIDLILSAQQHPKRRDSQGGWRYEPTSSDADLSVSVWQLMALRSAKNDGLQVPSSAIDEALQYLQRSYTSALDRDGQPRDAVAGFSYTPGQRSATFTMTAAGLLAVQVCGQYDSPLVQGATQWLQEHPPSERERFFYYGMYYYAQGMQGRDKAAAQTARKLVEDLLLEQQKPDGSWLAARGEERGVGPIYATSLAVLSLSVKYHYLPIYQR